jgi:hypothetical protein
MRNRFATRPAAQRESANSSVYHAIIAQSTKHFPGNLHFSTVSEQ